MATTTRNLSHIDYVDTQPGTDISWGWRELIRIYELFIVVAMSSLALTVLLTAVASPLGAATGLLPGWFQSISLFVLSSELLVVTVPTAAIAGALVVNLVAVILGLAIYRRLPR